MLYNIYMILGIDEVGRGPWAGPLVIGAVVLGDPQAKTWEGLNDSKKLTAKKREQQSRLILGNAKVTGLGWVEASEIDTIGLSEALKLATMRAICDSLKVEPPKQIADFDIIIRSANELPFSEIIIDGTINFLKETSLESITTILPKADSKIKEVSAASIIAKVARDNYMIKLSEKYPEYGFEKHVGYGTKKHKEALEKFGPCPEHRRSFRPIAKIISDEQGIVATKDSSKHLIINKDNKADTTSIGRKAEAKVSDYLKTNGHTILARNHKTKYYEIDIISATKDHIFFTEVKYRKNSTHGEPLDFIDQKKQKQMSYAAESFMQFLTKKLNKSLQDLPSPVLAVASVSGEDYHLDKWFTVK